MKRINVLKDIYKFLELDKKRANDILWVGSKDGAYAVSWETFAKMAKRTYYTPENDSINCNLVIVGKDWWLERNHQPYQDGWDFFSFPKLQATHSSFDESSEHFNILSNED